jgi:LmbE family N-acetylglucosaminyl deacetylase
MSEPQESKRVLLAVLAHPDDESFGMGGTLALYASRGVEVHLVCATRGEVGGVDAKYMQGFNSIAERRESELRCAAGHLRLAGVHFLGYRDSGMAGSLDNQHPQALAFQPVEQVAREVMEYIRRLRPQVVVTFDPIGGYKHPDHIAIHQATVLAFQMAADASITSDYPPYQARKLYFHIIPKGFLRLGVRVLRLFGQDPRRFGQNKDIDLVALLEEGDFPTHAVIEYGKVARQAEQAAACHASQGGERMANGPARWIQRLLGLRDQFMRAYPPVENHLKEVDLFEMLE